jgi:hypothetical protein
MDPVATSASTPSSPQSAAPSAFVQAFNAVADLIHTVNVSKGWWEDDQMAETVYHRLLGTGMTAESAGKVRDKLRRNHGEALMLVVTEIAEAMEGLRAHNPPDDKIGHLGYSAMEAECADAVIRLMDLCQARGWRLAEAIEAKLAYNRTRAFKHGGKAC